MAHSGRQFTQKPLIGVNEQPVLLLREARREISHVRAGSGGQVERTDGSLRQRIDGVLRDRSRTRRAVGRLTQREPIAGEAAHTLCQGLCHSSAGLLPGWQARAHPPSPLGKLFAIVRVGDYTRERMGERVGICGRHDEAAARVHEIADGSRARGNHRQTARECLRHHHAVAFVQRRQHENVGGIVEPLQGGAAHLAGK